MPIYIATVYMAAGMAIAAEGNAAVTRHIVREIADTPEQFEAGIRDRFINDPDAVVEFGPIGLSKRQR